MLHQLLHLVKNDFWHFWIEKWRLNRCRSSAFVFLKFNRIVFLKSILWTFYGQLLRWHSFTEKLQSQTVIRQNLCKIHSYKKGARKRLMKLTPFRSSLKPQSPKACRISCTSLGNPGSWPDVHNIRIYNAGLPVKNNFFWYLAF